MANYNFYGSLENLLRGRYDTIFEGAEKDKTLRSSIELWRETFTEGNTLPTVDAMQELLLKLKALPPMKPQTPCPQYRVFVSHRQTDQEYALRIAEIANNRGFSFWLDVLDPHLTVLNALTGLPPHQQAQKALLAACVIEMGLLNSTHVLAVMTINSQASEWIPYEYGRVRKVNRQANTGCWEYLPKSSTYTLPEYMLLGKITSTEQDIEDWLDGFKPSCPPVSWTEGTTTPLP